VHTDQLLSLAADLAQHHCGRSTRVQLRELSVKSRPERRWLCAAVQDGEVLIQGWGATPGGAVRDLVRELLPAISATHRATAGLVGRARSAGLIEV